MIFYTLTLNGNEYTTDYFGSITSLVNAINYNLAIAKGRLGCSDSRSYTEEQIDNMIRDKECVDILMASIN
jgi:hypothetical protein